MANRKYTIKKGRQYQFSYLLPTIGRAKEISGTIKFVGDFSYDFSDKEDMIDTNKIIGLSNDFHHRCNSIRLGWRWNKDTKDVDIMIIRYIEGIRDIEYLTCASPNVEHKFHIKIENRQYNVMFNDKERTLSALKFPSWFHYLCQPYFGGQQKAPKDFNFHIKFKRK